jgi:hypothetical protein
LTEEDEAEPIDEERQRLYDAEDKIIKIMQDAISDGILTKAERAEIDNAIEEIRKIAEADGVISESEKRVMEKIEKTLSMILKIEKDFISTYWKTKKKK